MKVSLNGYGESVTTFEAEDSVKAGSPVKILSLIHISEPTRH